MSLLLVRHSDAVPADRDIDDDARWLSVDGREKARRVGEALAARGISFDRFLASPRVRAVQTAEIIAQTIGFEGAIEVLPSLCHTASPHAAAQALQKLHGTTAVFGHMPTLAQTASALVGDSVSGFKTCEARFIEQRRVVWGVDPDRV